MLEASGRRGGSLETGIAGSLRHSAALMMVVLASGALPSETLLAQESGSLVARVETVPEDVNGSFRVTGIPTGTFPSGGTVIAANITPGFYNSTMLDPAPEFDVTEIRCDDADSPSPSLGDAASRTAVYQLDPGETVTCTWVVTRRGTLVVEAETVPEGLDGTFEVTGVPPGQSSGVFSSGESVVDADLNPGTYNSTMLDPAPEFDVTEIRCDDADSPSPSLGDAASRTAVFNLDPGETVTCTFVVSQVDSVQVDSDRSTENEDPAEPSSPLDEGPWDSSATDPFDDPTGFLEEFRLPVELPPDTDAGALLRAGPWVVHHFAGRLTCGANSMSIPPGPSSTGEIQVLDGGRTLVGTGMSPEGPTTIRLTASSGILGRYSGEAEGVTDMGPVQMRYVWQVVTPEHIVGNLQGSATLQGRTCELYEPYELEFDGP